MPLEPRFALASGGSPLKDLDLAVKSYEDALNDLIALATPEQCLARLTPEQCLTRLTPEQRLAGLAPEQCMAQFTPEQRVAGLGPEQVLLALPDDILRGLSPECLRTLSEATRAAIRARIGA